jgi:hypothetical protein
MEVRMKKIFFTLIFCVGLTVFAYADNVGETIGYVIDIYEDVIFISGEPLGNGFPNALVKIGDAPIYDLRTGTRAFADEIEIDMDVRAIYNVYEEPFDALVVWLNWDDDDAAVFTVTASENITASADGMVFLSTEGKYRVALTHDTIILDPYQGLLSPADVVPGMEFFVWVDMITASTPALVYPDKVVVVH